MPKRHPFDVYLEVGQKRVFAGALEWPGWCRGGRDEAGALGALADSAPRYAKLLATAGLDFAPPKAADMEVTERLGGNSTTEFGAPDIAPAADARPIDADELARFQALLRAYWGALDAAIGAATGRKLRSGPRGGGRDLASIMRHVGEAEAGYLGRVAWKREYPASDDPAADLARSHQSVLDALEAAVRDGLPERGPRGGAIWLPRYFVRRVGWHALDHAWEIEDRLIEA